MGFVVGVVKFWLTLVAIALLTLVVGKFAGSVGAYAALALLVISEAAWVWRKSSRGSSRTSSHSG